MEIWVWLGFLGVILLLLGFDLGAFHRHPGPVSVKEALAWSGFWITLALGFNTFVFFLYQRQWLGFGTVRLHDLGGLEAALQFFTSYLLLKSLAIDNILVIALVLAHFRIPLAYQHRLLFWGIAGAIVLRALMIAGGAALMFSFSWIVYVLGGLLLVTALKLLVVRHDNLEPDKNVLVRTARRLMPTVPGTAGGSLTMRQDDGRRALTRLGMALLVVASSDVLYAADSVPATFAVTADPFLVFTSNVFALFGLRALYFALAGIIHRLRYLKMSLVFVLVFVAVKVFLTHHQKVPTVVSMTVVVGMLLVGVAASVWAPHRDTAPLESPLAPELENLTRLGLRGARRVAILVLGSSVILVGVAMIFLPGPGSLVIPAGIAILAIEFMWARRWLVHFRRAAKRLGQEVEERGRFLFFWRKKPKV